MANHAHQPQSTISRLASRVAAYMRKPNAKGEPPICPRSSAIAGCRPTARRVTRLDRLARSTRDLLNVLHEVAGQTSSAVGLIGRLMQCHITLVCC